MQPPASCPLPVPADALPRACGRGLGGRKMLTTTEGRAMQRILTMGGSFFDHPPAPDRLAGLNWEARRAFLAVQRTGSVRAAALDVRKTANTVRRLLDALEAELGMKLVERR